MKHREISFQNGKVLIIIAVNWMYTTIYNNVTLIMMNKIILLMKMMHHHTHHLQIMMIQYDLQKNYLIMNSISYMMVQKILYLQQMIMRIQKMKIIMMTTTQTLT